MIAAIGVGVAVIMVAVVLGNASKIAGWTWAFDPSLSQMRKGVRPRAECRVLSGSCPGQRHHSYLRWTGACRLSSKVVEQASHKVSILRYHILAQGQDLADFAKYSGYL